MTELTRGPRAAATAGLAATAALVATTAGVAVTGSAQADTSCSGTAYTWIGGGNWTDASSWSPAGVPGAADTVTVNNFTGSGSPDASLLGYVAAASATASGSNANAGSDTWNLFYQSDSSATGSQVAWTNVGTNFTFDSTGNLSPSVSSVPLTGVTIDGTVLGNIAIKLNGLTQFATSTGSATVTSLNQDGYPPGQLQSITISKEGRIAGSFTNGKNVDLAQIPLYSFASPNNLKSLDGGAFAITGDSGPALMGASGQLVGAALEGSNADIADQFTKLIVTQQAYSANTGVITTANQMSQDMLNMLR